MSEYVIKDLSSEEIDSLEAMGEDAGIDWCPDDVMLGSGDVRIYGSRKDVKKVMQIIGRS